jgi:hypothetical protein
MRTAFKVLINLLAISAAAGCTPNANTRYTLNPDSLKMVDSITIMPYESISWECQLGSELAEAIWLELEAAGLNPIPTESVTSMLESAKVPSYHVMDRGYAYTVGKKLKSDAALFGTIYECEVSSTPDGRQFIGMAVTSQIVETGSGTVIWGATESFQYQVKSGESPDSVINEAASVIVRDVIKSRAQ